MKSNRFILSNDSFLNYKKNNIKINYYKNLQMVSYEINKNRIRISWFYTINNTNLLFQIR